MAGREIIVPSVIGVVLLSPFFAWFYLRYGTRSVVGPFGVLGIAGLFWIAVLGVFSAAGYSALGVALVVAQSSVTIETTRWLRIVIVAVGVAAVVFSVVAMRKRWQSLFRMLAILGYAYAALAAVRLISYPAGIWRATNRADVVHQLPPQSAPAGGAQKTARPREVVWLILDELDYNQTLGMPAGPIDPPMPNLVRLASLGVSATAAWSPAKDTVASIPALLSGYALNGLDFESDGLWLKTREHGLRRFDQTDSVFGRLPNGPANAAILGFYHPYCWLFPSVSPCVSSPDENVSRWFDALTFFARPMLATAKWIPEIGERLPSVLFQAFAPMYRISDVTLRQIPRFLSIDDKALVYIHVNLPHAPADFSQRLLQLDTVSDDRDSYKRNLKVVDDIIGKVIATLGSRANSADILLIVSSDHWHRIDSPTTPQRIPWIAWHVGESSGPALDQKISTVHTGDLVVDFLNSKVDDQNQIVDWWNGRSTYPPLMPHGYDY